MVSSNIIWSSWFSRENSTASGITESWIFFKLGLEDTWMLLRLLWKLTTLWANSVLLVTMFSKPEEMQRFSLMLLGVDVIFVGEEWYCLISKHEAVVVLEFYPPAVEDPVSYFCSIIYEIRDSLPLTWPVENLELRDSGGCWAERLLEVVSFFWMFDIRRILRLVFLPDGII